MPQINNPLKFGLKTFSTAGLPAGEKSQMGRTTVKSQKTCKTRDCASIRTVASTSKFSLGKFLFRALCHVQRQ